MPSISTPTERRVALFVFAHQDDEFAAAPWIHDSISRGDLVYCVFLTDGGSRTSAEVRDCESRSVLRRLNVRLDNIAFLGNDARIPDGKLVERLPQAEALLGRWMQNRPTPTTIYMPDWEGGHPDHDAAHLVAMSYALGAAIDDLWAFPIYNGYRCMKPFFSTLRSLPGGPHKFITHNIHSGWSWAMLCWSYPSQRRTWIALFPGAFFTRVIMRRDSIRRCDYRRLLNRPHEGKLLYERLFGITYQQFVALSQDFLDGLSARKSIGDTGGPQEYG